MTAGLRLSTRLMLVIALCLLPTIGLQVMLSWNQWVDRKAQLGELATHQAELLAGNLTGIVEGAQILLGAAAEFRQVRTLGEGCQLRLTNLRRHAPGFAFIAVLDAEGHVRCASDGLQPADMQQPDWARDPVRASPGQAAGRSATGSIVAGRFARTALSPNGILPFYLPVRGAGSVEVGAAEVADHAAPAADASGAGPSASETLVAGLDLVWLAQHLSGLKHGGSSFLAGGVLSVVDADGVLLARDIRHAEFVGRRLPDAAAEALRANRPGLLRLRSIDGADRVVGYTPPTAANHRIAAMVGFTEPELMGALERTLLRGGLLLAAVGFLAFGLTLLVARRFIAQPTGALLAVVQRWRDGDRAARAPDWDRRSEFGQIAAAWNAMVAELRRREDDLRGHADVLEARVAERTQELVLANARLTREIEERQQTEAALHQAQKMQAVGQLAGGIAHDFNNVLQAVMGGVTLIRRRAGDTVAIQRLAGMVEDAARRGESVTRRLLAFSRREELRAAVLDVRDLLEGLREVLAATLGARIHVALEAPASLPPVLVDRGQLETVLLNLATNARDAMPGGGRLTLIAEVVPAGPAAPAGLQVGDYVRLTVADTGRGMSAMTLARAAEPFFTTKPLGQGTGLGLAMARSFAQGSGGALAIDSEPGQGTQVALWLPVTAAEAASPAPAAPANTGQCCALAAGRRARVLLVDDEAMVREVLAAQLADAGFVVSESPNGAAALRRLERGENFDVLVSDLAMPGLDGVALIREAQRRQPGLPAILVTGYAGDVATLAVGAAVDGAFVLMRKPVSGAQLADQVAALLGATANDLVTVEA